MWIALILGLAAAAVDRAPSAFEDTVSGTKCTNRPVSDGSQMECTVVVGADLRFTIAGVGEEMAAIAFERSSSAGDYYGKVGMMHGCVVVTPGDKHKNALLAGLAFVSPRSGRVFRTWMECKGH
jgi:hypothetical protein